MKVPSACMVACDGAKRQVAPGGTADPSTARSPDRQKTPVENPGERTEYLRRPQPPQHGFAEAAAERQLCPVAQQDGVVAVERGLQRLDAVNVDQRRAMYTQELARAQAVLQRRNSFAQDVGDVTHVQQT